jgi:hypothetical protein
MPRDITPSAAPILPAAAALSFRLGGQATLRRFAEGKPGAPSVGMLKTLRKHLRAAA